MAFMPTLCGLEAMTEAAMSVEPMLETSCKRDFWTGMQSESVAFCGRKIIWIWSFQLQEQYQ